MCIKAVVFDMDGVLIDAKEWHYEALNQALALFGHTITRADHVAKYDGLPTRTKLACLTELENLPESLHSFINEMKQTFTLQIVAERLRPNFAHEYALARLKREGFRLGLASNSVRLSITDMMRRSHLDKYLDYMLSNQDVIKGKPSPEIYQKAIEMAAVRPEETLVVEDHPFGVQAAEGAGAHVLRVEGVHEVNYVNIRRKIDQIANQATTSPRAALTKRAA